MRDHADIVALWVGALLGFELYAPHRLRFVDGESPIKLDILYTITRYDGIRQLIPHLFVCKMINVAQQSSVVVVNRVLTKNTKIFPMIQ